MSPGAQAQDEVPADVLAAARAAFDERMPDVLVAELVHDVDGIQDDERDDRLLAFAGAGVEFSVRVEHRPGAQDAALVVEVHPPDYQELALHRPGQPPLAVPARGPSRFRVVVAGRGLFSLAVSGPRGPVRTTWTRL